MSESKAGEEGEAEARPPGDPRPLEGRLILITRPAEEAARMGGILESLGAQILVAPTIRIEEPQDWAPVDEAVRWLSAYDWIIFTSANGPRYLAGRMEELRLDPKNAALQGPVLAIGPATAAAVEKYLGKTPEKVARKYVAQGVVALFAGEELAGRRALLARAKEGRDVIPDALRAMGAVVDDIAVYRTTLRGSEALSGVREELEAGKIDMLTFTSSSTLRGFIKAAGEETAKKWMRGAKVASIGPATTGAAREWGIVPDVEAAESTIHGMAEAIVSFYEKTASGLKGSRP